MIRLVISTVGILFDMTAAIIVTWPIATRSQSEEEELSISFANSVTSRSIWGGRDSENEVLRQKHMQLGVLRIEKRKARWAIYFVITGVLCNLSALWWHFL